MPSVRWILALVAFGLACASVPIASPELNEQGYRFGPPQSGKVVLYVYRLRSVFGMSNALNVVVNGKLVGSTASGTYMMLELTPGSIEVATYTGESLQRVVIQAQSDSTYFIRQQSTAGLADHRSKLQLVDAVAGRLGVESCRRVVSLPVTQ